MHHFVPAVERRVICTHYKMTFRTSALPLYSEIARENAKKIASVEARIHTFDQRLADSVTPDELQALNYQLMPLEHDLGKLASIVIVFAMISVEAYIYDYAARHLSDKYVQDYIDKLDVVGKLVVVPRLVTGREMPRHKKWFSLVKSIVKARNSIVHSKSSEPPHTVVEARQYFVKIKDKDDQTLQAAKQSIELLDALVVEISEIDPDETIWVESILRKTSQMNLEAK